MAQGYRNMLQAQPLEFGNDEQIRMILDATHPEYASNVDDESYGAWYDSPLDAEQRESAFWECIRCRRSNAATSKEFFFKHRVITPFIYHCQECGQRIFFFRAPFIDQVDDDPQWWLHPETWPKKAPRRLYRRLLGAYEYVNPMRFLTNIDPLKKMIQ